jgi:serine/threonine protein kinase
MCSMWSLGCLLVEIHQGRPLFRATTEGTLMGEFIELLGIPPAGMIRASAKGYFEGSGGAAYRFIGPARPGTRSWETVLRQPDHYDGRDEFLALIRRMLEYDPAKRITPQEALRHPFFDVFPISTPTPPAGPPAAIPRVALEPSIAGASKPGADCAPLAKAGQPETIDLGMARIADPLLDRGPTTTHRAPAANLAPIFSTKPIASESCSGSTGAARDGDSTAPLTETECLKALAAFSTRHSPVLSVADSGAAPGAAD